jgi:hypothetical protein
MITQNRYSKPKEKEAQAKKLWFEKEATTHFPFEEGWEMVESSAGYPDLMYYRKDTGEVVLVELKAGSHGFHAHQKRIMDILVNVKKIRGKVARTKDYKVYEVRDYVKEPTRGTR